METITELKARITRITTSAHPVTDHNKAIINSACKELYARTGEVMMNGRFVKVA